MLNLTQEEQLKKVDKDSSNLESYYSAYDHRRLIFFLSEAAENREEFLSDFISEFYDLLTNTEMSYGARNNEGTLLGEQLSVRAIWIVASNRIPAAERRFITLNLFYHNRSKSSFNPAIEIIITRRQTTVKATEEFGIRNNLSTTEIRDLEKRLQKEIGEFIAEKSNSIILPPAFMLPTMTWEEDIYGK